ncbi:hypothetical protein [Ramlibacter pallidus]|uniref:Lipoprotein n=1 Tax=Ramlibacter pallidus TaxID=2780087 RepID=A0ABR9S1Y1_9BURK|nr:hypothetical protein [Ramlibacter pallidus]MBE7367527.1 hypothetical protein [Ramlibacter pallidus]
MKTPFALLAISLSATLVACGKADAPDTAEADAKEQAAPAAQQAAAPAAPTPPAAPVRKEPTVEDIERWQRGMAAEKKAVQEAAAKLAATAKDDQAARLEALSASLEMNTLDAGAAAAGVDRDAYRRIRSTFSEAVSTLSPLEMEMDVSKMPANMVEQMKQGREQSAAQLAGRLSPDLFAALKTRAAELRQQDKELVGERLKVASAAR